MTVTVHLFARARELAAADTVSLNLSPGATVADLRRALAERYPALEAILSVSMIAVNHEFAADELVLGDAELAIIPPVSGGDR